MFASGQWSKSEKGLFLVMLIVVFLFTVIITFTGITGTPTEKSDVRAEMPTIYSGVVVGLADSTDNLWDDARIRVIRVAMQKYGVSQTYDVAVNINFSMVSASMGDTVFFYLKQISQSNHGGTGSPMAIDMGMLLRDDVAQDLLSMGATLVNK
jgi:hypothetical protein